MPVIHPVAARAIADTPEVVRVAAMPPATRSAPARRSPRPSTRRLPRPDYPVQRHTTSNGLRVILAPDRSAGVVGVSVHYDVGFRSEPLGRTGFAHLFEHLMFQGSESLPKLEHFRLVQSSGGIFNGSTHTDYTDYFEVLPPNALERGLFLEADRMRAPNITAENLANQVDVVSEEIRLNVLSRPYGGFPWITLPPVLFDTFANAHDGYGAFEDLQAATVSDCADFFEQYYTPANAVLTVAGDLDPDTALELIERHFADVVYRPAPKRPSFAEPAPAGVREGDRDDAYAPVPALAIGYRLPDPVADLPGYLADILLGAILSDGEASRMQSTIVATAQLATDIWANPGLMGGPLDARDPDVFVVGAIHPNEVPAAVLVEAVDEQIALLADAGPTADECARAAARFAAGLYRDSDNLGSRTRSLGALELLHGRAELLAELPALVSGLTPDDVQAAARLLDPDSRAILRIHPSGHTG